jgi:hypothetical protein
MIGLSVNIKVIGTPEAVRFIENKVDDLEMKLAEQIVIESRRLIDESTPTGRLYRRKAFGRGAVRGLGVRASGPGRRFHRASAPGQPPAKFGAPYAGYLEFNLNRPFILPAIERAVDKVFNQ